MWGGKPFQFSFLLQTFSIWALSHALDAARALQALIHTPREREREREPRSAPTHTPPVCRTAPHQCRPTPVPIKQRSTPTLIAPRQSTLAPIADPHQRRSLFLRLLIWPDLMNFFFLGFVSFVFLCMIGFDEDFFWVFFLLCFSVWPDLMNIFSGFCFFCVSVLRNDIIYLFGSWENVRKCEQEVENVFSMVFSRTQPNTRKYFSKHFLKCNQTLENIFLSRK